MTVLYRTAGQRPKGGEANKRAEDIDRTGRPRLVAGQFNDGQSFKKQAANMTTQEGDAYVKHSRECLTRAAEELVRGDLSTASAKGWAAASEMVRALACERGWEHESLRDIHRALSNLVTETHDKEYRLLFAMAGELDTNSDEGFLSEVAVLAHLNAVMRFVDKMEAALDGKRS